MTDILRIITSFSGAFAFSLLFSLRGKRLLFASLGGLLCGVIFYFSSLISNREVFRYFTASIGVTIYTEIVARLLKSPSTCFLSSGIIPLVPGGTLYLSMSAALHGDLNLFFSYGMEAVYISLSIAGGILLISPLRTFLLQLHKILKKPIKTTPNS